MSKSHLQLLYMNELLIYFLVKPKNEKQFYSCWKTHNTPEQYLSQFALKTSFRRAFHFISMHILSCRSSIMFSIAAYGVITYLFGHAIIFPHVKLADF